jgi:hypothetical protein
LKPYRQKAAVSFLALPAILAFLVCFAFSAPAHAVTTIPYKMNFQGRLTDASGNPMAAGTYNMKFRIYDASSAGTLKWSEQRANSASTGVTVTTGGLFSVQLGDVSSLPANIFSTTDTASLFFEIELPTPATATCSTAACESYTEGPMAPRNKLASSAYSFNSDLLDGLDSSAFAQVGANTTFTGTLGVNVSSTAAFTVGTSGTNMLTVDTASASVIIGTADSTAQVLVLDANASDPGATAGAMYYNSTSGKFRCYQGGWTDCIAAAGGSTLQSAYDASSPATITTTAAKGVHIVTGAAPTTDIFSVDTTANPVTTDNVNGIDVNYVGGAGGSIEGAGLRVDYTPGSTSTSTWDGVRIVANATGPASGVTTYGLKLEGPSTPGAGMAVGIKVAGGFDIGVDISSGSLQMAAVSTEPAAPAAGNMKIYAKDIAGRMVLKTVGPSGLDTPYQPALFANNIAMLLPNTAATVTAWGMPNTAVGTVTTPAITSTNLLTSMRRMTVTSTTTANSASELRAAAPLVWRGNAAGLGGFFYAARFSVGSTTANQRLFSGLTATTGATATTIAPSAIVNMVGIGWDSADANLQIMSNDSTGIATKVDLGASYPANSTTAVYELVLFAAANGSTIGYRVQRLDTNQITSGTISTNLPTNTSLLTHHQYMNNGGTAAAVVLNVNRVYIESDY